MYLLLKLIRLSRAGNYALDRIDALDTGGRQSLVEKTIVARTMRTLGTLIASGVPILEAMATSSSETANNVVFERMFQRVLESPSARATRSPTRCGRAGSSMTW